MSRYTSLCRAITIFEDIRNAFRDDRGDTDTYSEIIRDLQDVAKDIRYGGEWHGDQDTVAGSLDFCAENECALCTYHNFKIGCSRTLKKDAAAAIRSLGERMKAKDETIAKMAEEIDEMRGDAYDSDFQAAEPAEWQKEIMEAMADGKLPY